MAGDRDPPGRGATDPGTKPLAAAVTDHKTRNRRSGFAQPSLRQVEGAPDGG